MPAPVSDLFPPHGATVSALREGAETLSTGATSYRDVAESVRTGAERSAAQTQGDVTPVITDNGKPPEESSHRVGDASLYASGVVGSWASAVETYDAGVADINTRYRELAKAEPIDEPAVEALRAEHTGLRGTLEQARDEVVRRLKAGPNAADLAALLRDGEVGAEEYLGASSSIHEGQQDAVALAEQRKTLLTDIAGMSDADLTTHLREHPEAFEDPEVWDLVADRVDGWTAGDASADATTIAEARDGKAKNFDGVNDAMTGLGLLGAVAGVAQRTGRQLPGSSGEYLRTFYGDVAKGKDGIQGFVDWVGDDEHTINDPHTTKTTVSGYMGYPVPVTQTHETRDVPGFDQATQDAMLGSLATGLVAVSDADLGGGLGWDAVPQSVKDQLGDTPKYDVYQATAYQGNPGPKIVSLEGGGGFGDLTDLLGHARPDITAGDELSRGLTDASAAAAGAVNSVEGSSDNYNKGDALEAWQDRLQGTVAIATRNEEANTAFLTDAGDVKGKEATALTNLYTFSWKDDGATVADYTDWIPGHPDRALADRASVAAINAFTATPGATPEGEDPVPGTFEKLMTGVNADYVDQDAPRSVGELNPYVSRSLAGIAATQIDHLASYPAPGADTKLEADGMNISDGDRSRLVTLVAGDGDSRHDLSVAVGAYQQHLVDTELGKLSRGEEADLQTAGQQSGYLDGLMGAGIVNDSLIHKNESYETALAEYKQHLLSAQIGKNIGFGLIGAIPGVPVLPGAVSAVGTGLGEAILQGSITEPPLPDGVNVGDFGNEGAENRRLAYDFMTAKVRTFPDDQLPPAVSDLLDADGNPPAYDKLTNAQTNQMLAWAQKDDRFTDYQNYSEGADTFEQLVVDDRGAVEKSSAMNDYLRGVRLP